VIVTRVPVCESVRIIFSSSLINKQSISIRLKYVFSCGFHLYLQGVSCPAAVGILICYSKTQEKRGQDKRIFRTLYLRNQRLGVRAPSAAISLSMSFVDKAEWLRLAAYTGNNGEYKSHKERNLCQVFLSLSFR
jgi:hypothetical protein